MEKCRTPAQRISRQQRKGAPAPMIVTTGGRGTSVFSSSVVGVATAAAGGLAMASGGEAAAAAAGVPRGAAALGIGAVSGVWGV